jgi:hypothetical protein
MPWRASMTRASCDRSPFACYSHIPWPAGPWGCHMYGAGLVRAAHLSGQHVAGGVAGRVPQRARTLLEEPLAPARGLWRRGRPSVSPCAGCLSRLPLHWGNGPVALYRLLFSSLGACMAIMGRSSGTFTRMAASLCGGHPVCWQVQSPMPSRTPGHLKPHHNGGLRAHWSEL